MIHRKRIRAFARSSLAVFIAIALGACSASADPTSTAQTPNPATRQPGVAERWQKRVFSAASTIQLATYSFARPIGTSSPPAGCSLR